AAVSSMLTPAASPGSAAAPASAPSIREVEMRLLEPGMVMGEDVRTSAGRVLIKRGEVVTADAVRQVKGTLGFNELRQPVRVQLPAAKSASVAAAAAVAAAPATPAVARTNVSAGGLELDLTMRLTV